MNAHKSTTAISLTAQKPYVQALRALAEQKEMSIGLMVRKALDAQLGADLAPFVSFFEELGNKSFQVEENSSIG